MDKVKRNVTPTNFTSWWDELVQENMPKTAECGASETISTKKERMQRPHTRLVPKVENNQSKLDDPPANFEKHLKECMNGAIAEPLLKDSVVPEDSKTIIWFDTTEPVTTIFVNRNEEIDEINKYRLECGDSKFCFVSIVGQPGLGKNDLARIYAATFSKEKQGHVIWINADTNLSLISSFTRLAKILAIHTKNNKGGEKTLEQTKTAVYNKVRNLGDHTLFIFQMEMVTDIQEHITDITRTWSGDFSGHKKPTVMFTSRMTLNWKSFDEKWPLVIKLEILSAVAAQNCVRKGLSVENSNKEINGEIEKLCKNLAYVPMALQQLIDFAKKRSSNSDLLHVLKEYEKIIDGKQETPLDTDQHRLLQAKMIPPQMYKSYLGLFHNILHYSPLGNIALEVVNVISLLFRLNIKIEFVFRLVDTDKYIFDQTISVLIHNVLIKIGDNNEIEVQPLLQDVIQIILDESKKLYAILEKLLTTTSKILKNTVTQPDLLHFITIWGHASKNKELVKKYQEIPCHIARVCYETKKFRTLYDFTKAYGHLLEECVGVETPWTRGIEFWRGMAMQSVGNYDAALEILYGVLEKQTTASETEEALKTSRYIGRVYHQKGLPEEALTWYTNTLAKRMELSTKENLETFLLKTNIGRILDEQEKYREALAYYLEALRIQKYVLGSDKMEILNTEQDIGILLSKWGKFEKAKKIFTKVLIVREKILGSDHYLTITTKNNLACTMLSEGKFEEALSAFSEVLTVEERVRGNEHSDTLTTMGNIALTLKEMGRNDDALEKYREIVEVREKVFGREDKDTLKVKRDLGVTLYSQGKHEAGLKMLQEVLHLQKNVLGLNHTDTLMTQQIIADTERRGCTVM